MVGAPGTPLARKLGIREASTLALVVPPPGWAVPDLPPGVDVVETGADGVAAPTDVVLAFCREGAVLRAGAATWGSAVFPGGAVWVAWRRKAAGHRSDLSGDRIREVVLPLGLVDVKVAALDRDWSGLKLVWRKELRDGDGPPAGRA